MIQLPALGVSQPVFVESMIRSTLTIAALTIASMTGSVHADTVRGALCGLKRLAPGSSVEEFSCDFTQLQGNAYITGSRWKFAFPEAEQNKTYQRQNSDDFVRFIRKGQYSLTVYQSGVKPLELGP